MRTWVNLIVAALAAGCGAPAGAPEASNANGAIGAVRTTAGPGGAMASGARTPQQACIDVMPNSLPQPVLASYPTGSEFHDPFRPISDGLGSAATLVQIGTEAEPFELHFLHVANGQLTDWASSVTGSDMGAFQLYGETHGFMSVQRGQNGPVLAAYDDSGVEVGSAMLPQPVSYLDPTVAPTAGGGGAWAVTQLDASAPARLQLAHYDEQAALSGTALVTSGATQLQFLAVAASGDALVVWDEGGLRARWFGPDLQPRTASFSLPGQDLMKSWALPLADGSVAIAAEHLDGATEVLAVVPDASASLEPAPQWLQTRISTSTGLPPNMALVRHGTAYAFWPVPACAGVELVASDGTSCGCLVIPDMNDNLSFGVDGSVLFPTGDHVNWYVGLLE